MLVLHDMLGLSLSGRVPKFVKNFMREHGDIPAAIAGYVKAVKAVEFPQPNTVSPHERRQDHRRPARRGASRAARANASVSCRPWATSTPVISRW